MSTILQIELKHYIENHEVEAMMQGDGVALLIPITLANGNEVQEWIHVETYREARVALGY